MSKKSELKKQLLWYEEAYSLLEEENERLSKELEAFSYSKERIVSLTKDERIEMLLIDAESACKELEHNPKSIMSYYNKQTKSFAQMYRDEKENTKRLARLTLAFINNGRYEDAKQEITRVLNT